MKRKIPTKKLTRKQTKELAALKALPDDKIDFSDIPEVTDWGGAVVGKFYRPAETRSEAQDKYERIKACIPPAGALAWMSGHFGLDFSKYSPDEYVQNIEVPGIQGLFESIIYAKGGAPVAVKEAAMIYAQGMGMPVAVGTPAARAGYAA